MDWGEVQECRIISGRVGRDKGTQCPPCPFRRVKTENGSGCVLIDQADSVKLGEFGTVEMGLGVTALERRYVPREKVRNADTVERLKEIARDRGLFDQKVAIEKSAANIATAMTRIHGGRWRIEIDHLTGFVLVRRNSHG